MTGLRTVGGGLPGPYTVTTTNLYDNPGFRRVGTSVDARRNLALDPAGTKNINAAGHCGWFHMWYGSAPGNGNTTVITGAGDGPVSGVTTYVRKTWTVAPAANADTGFYNTAATAPTGFFPVSADTTYTVSSYVRTSASGKRARTRIAWFDSTDTMIPNEVFQFGSISNTPTLVPNTWTRLSLTATAPSNAVKARFLSDIGHLSGDIVWAPGDTLDGSALLVEKSNRLGTYFDGRTASVGGLTHVWAGTADAANAVAQGSVPNNVTVSRGYLYRVDPSGAATHRPNELTTSNDVYLGPGGDAGGFRLGMVPGKTYTFSAEGMASAADAGEHGMARTVSIWWRTAAGAYVFAKSTGTIPVGTMGPRISVTATIPSDATEAFVRLYNGSYLRDVTWGNVLLQEGSGSAFFDGNTVEDATTHCRWSGGVDASTSEKISRLPFSAFAPDGTTLATMQKVPVRKNLFLNPTLANVNGTAEVRRNLVPGGFEVDTNADGVADGWVSYVSGTVGATTYSVVAGNGSSGAQRIQATAIAAGGITHRAGMRYSIPTGGGIVAGSQMTFSLDLKGTFAAGQQVLVYVDFSNGVGFAGNINWAIDATTIQPTWSRFSRVAGTVPAGAVSAVAYVWVSNGGSTAADADLYVDNLLIEQAGVVLPFMDGATPASQNFTYAWTGTPHASASTATGKTLNGSFSAVRGVGYQFSPGSDGASGYCARAAVNNTTGGGNGFRWVSTINTVPGQPYSVSGLMRYSLPGQFDIVIQWKDALSNAIATPNGSLTAVIAANTWTYVKFENVVAPPGAVKADVWWGLFTNATTAGATMDVDQLIIEQATTVGPFFHGSTPADGDYTYAWLGSPTGNTVSQANP